MFCTKILNYENLVKTIYLKACRTQLKWCVHFNNKTKNGFIKDGICVVGSWKDVLDTALKLGSDLLFHVT